VKGDVVEWIAVLHRIKIESPKINVVRLYTVPDCTFKGSCVEAFMRAADKLGIYIIAPGTGTVWGWLPGPGACSKSDECYMVGGVLGWGIQIVQKFSYPNTLAIAIGNEFDMQMTQFMPVLKAYARDLKKYMEMCNTEEDSPSKGIMRRIPLLYANSDDRGDQVVRQKMDYMFCGDRSDSIDIFGLNIERYCDKNGPRIYKDVSDWVGKARYPGAFVFSEDGCTKSAFKGHVRDWSQVPGFFQNFSAVDGYMAYAYFGNPDFDMFDGPSATAAINEDGRNFFRAVNASGVEPQREMVDPIVPECPTSILGKVFDSVETVKWYDTGSISWAPHCPKRPSPTSMEDPVVVV